MAKITDDHVQIATNLIVQDLGLRRTWPAKVTEGSEAYRSLHDSGAYRALQHHSYTDAHWRTALKRIFPNVVFR
ncbi:hypothetical protein SAMN03159338_1506 [Sphingomonas sp. NFR04]|uniref:hypothetical protein n=1 Tax=Sphingomonas sp. NFR04 TaxID=1566283 RepID=UPI0008F2D5F4|nr:hypothetical protein [Sphingomonas sp. NFR04]SFJ47862.1 hypothetical protein SAMN03159338_1506 [Sphingomonas sp. NFR04]